MDERSFGGGDRMPDNGQQAGAGLRPTCDDWEHGYFAVKTTSVDATADDLPVDPHDLRVVPFLAALNDDDLVLLASQARREMVPAQTTLCRRGEASDTLIVVERGCILLYVDRPGDPAGIVRIVCPGETFGECSLLTRNRSVVTAETFDPSTLILIPADPLRALVDQRFDAAVAVLGHVSVRLRRLLAQVSSLKTRTTAQRLAAHLASRTTATEGPAEVPLRYGKGLLARELGMQPETFSRAMMKLQSFGVRYRRSHDAFFVEDVARLRRFCEEDGDG